VKLLNGRETLAAILTLSSGEQFHLGWGAPRITIEAHQVMLSGTKERRELLDGEPVELPIWYAYKISRLASNGFPEIMEAANKKNAGEESYQVFLNNAQSPARLLSAEEIQQGDVYLTIQFVPIEKRPRTYRLDLKPWDQIRLVEFLESEPS